MSENKAPLYANGEWTLTRDEVSQAWAGEDRDYTEALTDAGFDASPWTQIGGTEMSLPLALVVYMRRGDAEPRFFVEVNSSSGFFHNVYAGDVADLMDLLSRWGPALQAAAVNEAVRQLLESRLEPGGASTLVRTLEKILRG